MSGGVEWSLGPALAGGMGRQGRHRPGNTEVVGNRAGTEPAVGDGDDGQGDEKPGPIASRCQERQQRTWCSSSPHSPLVACKHSSILQRHPATRARVAKDGAAGAAQR